ncbi:hypothetical protein J7L06_07360 [Candidatus Bathyarchaeota archaeon]|nr:hypothetical protein [Candidatus Bathyarchaeota archaeon]
MEKVFDRIVRFRCIPIKVKIGKHQMKGLSLYLNLNQTGELKLVPYKSYTLCEVSNISRALIRHTL